MGIRVQGLNYKLKMFSLKDPHHTRDLILSQFSVDCCQLCVYFPGPRWGAFSAPQTPSWKNCASRKKCHLFFFSPMTCLCTLCPMLQGASHEPPKKKAKWTKKSAATKLSMSVCRCTQYWLYRGFSRDVTRSRVCLVMPLISHFGGQAFGLVCAVCAL